MPDLVRSLTVGEFKRIALQRLERLVRALHEREDSTGSTFIKRDPTPLIRYQTERDVLRSISVRLNHLVETHPHFDHEYVRELEDLLGQVARLSSADRLLERFEKVLDLEDREFPGHRPAVDSSFSVQADSTRVYLRAPADLVEDKVAEAVESDITDVRYVASVMGLLTHLREARRLPTRDETAAVHAAYRLLDRGVHIPSAYASLGTSGFRDIQTYLSIADPGDGHINVTSTDPALLQGTAVHVEYIDRDNNFYRRQLEPYRLPAAITAARVRLHVGSAAPCTAFIGRPVFERRHVPRDLLKPVHLCASSCSALFMNGYADCKIAIEQMSATEAIEYMCCVAGNVVRDSSRQYLTAAFNIKTHIVDDRRGASRMLTRSYDIAQLGIDLAIAGGFDRVAWDGSSNQFPSRPIVARFSRAQLLELVHRAHENGLETYLSAGLGIGHVRQCVFAGVDGIGIGTSLHYADPKSGLMGRLKCEAIREALQARNLAEGEPLGRCARMLARLDRLFFEDALDTRENELRLDLFQALKDGDESESMCICAELSRVEGLPLNCGEPILEMGRRVIRAARPSGDQATDRMGEERARFINEIRHLVDCEDVAQLREVLHRRE